MKAPSKLPLFAGLALLLLATVTVGTWFYYKQEQHARREVEANLEVIAQLKANHIAQWRAERIGDAGVLMTSRFFAEGVAHWLAQPQAGDGDNILTRLRGLQHYGHYHDVVLVDGRGQIRLSSSERPLPFHDETVQALAVAFRTRQPVLTGLHAPPGSPVPQLEVIAPLFAVNQATNGPVGAVVLEVEARQFLYPMIQSWPTASTTAETLLVCRDGDAVLFLNDLRHWTNTALALRIPLTRREVPAVRAVLGQEGIFQGTDYRGIKVLSVLKQIPKCPWVMVAKIDETEALAEVRFRAMLVIVAMLALVTALGAIGTLFWQQQSRCLALTQAAKELRKSEERFSSLVNATSQIVWTTESAGKVTADWPTWRAYTGQTYEEIKGAGWADALHPEDRQGAFAVWQRAVASRSRYESEYRVRRRDGEYRSFTVCGVPVFEPDDRIREWVGTCTDITDRQLAESQLRLQATALEAAANPMVITNTQGVILWVNPAFAAHTGYTASEVLGKNPSILKSGKHDAAFYHGLWQTIMAGHVWRGEMVNRCKDGSLRLEEATITPLRNDRGELTHFIAIKRDITEQKQAEELVLMALREKEVLLKEIHHRVKNNLQVVSSLLAMQSDTVTDVGTRQILTESQSRVRAMAMIHEKLYQSSDLARVDFGEYVNNLVGFLYRSYSNADGRVALKVATDEVHLSIDAAVPCGLILNELVSNALKHAFKDGRQGEIRVELHVESDGYRLTVADNGAGLPANFDLVRMNSLGLQLVDTLCKQIRGRLAIQSPPGVQFQLFFKDLANSSRLIK